LSLSLDLRIVCSPYCFNQSAFGLLNETLFVSHPAKGLHDDAIVAVVAHEDFLVLAVYVNDKKVERAEGERTLTVRALDWSIDAVENVGDLI
jgi:hypothetical protein